jgi:hypothetical protein
MLNTGAVTIAPLKNGDANLGFGQECLCPFVINRDITTNRRRETNPP